MTKIKQLFAAAAALVIGGLALSVALRDAGVSVGVTCEQWRKAAAIIGEHDKQKVFWVSVPVGEFPPAAFDGKVIGNCADGKCTVKPTGCDASIDYTYQQTALVSGHRVLRVEAHDYFAGAIKTWVESIGGKWLGGYATAMSECKKHYAAAKCASLIGASSACFIQGDGALCRYGRTYRIDGPGRATDGACSPDANSKPYPCELRGGSVESDLAADINTNIELDKIGEP